MKEMSKEEMQEFVEMEERINALADIYDTVNNAIVNGTEAEISGCVYAIPHEITTYGNIMKRDAYDKAALIGWYKEIAKLNGITIDEDTVMHRVLIATTCNTVHEGEIIYSPNIFTENINLCKGGMADDGTSNLGSILLNVNEEDLEDEFDFADALKGKIKLQGIIASVITAGGRSNYLPISLFSNAKDGDTVSIKVPAKVLKTEDATTAWTDSGFKNLEGEEFDVVVNLKLRLDERKLEFYEYMKMNSNQNSSYKPEARPFEEVLQQDIDDFNKL